MSVHSHHFKGALIMFDATEQARDLRAREYLSRKDLERREHRGQLALTFLMFGIVVLGFTAILFAADVWAEKALSNVKTFQTRALARAEGW